MLIGRLSDRPRRFWQLLLLVGMIIGGAVIALDIIAAAFARIFDDQFPTMLTALIACFFAGVLGMKLWSTRNGKEPADEERSKH